MPAATHACRRGFTLIELLVATAVFVFGFTAALGLMLLGTRARSQADGMLRLGYAASTLLQEIRLEAGREDPAGGAPPMRPEQYVGDGFAALVTPDEELRGADAPLFRHPGQPGVWYRVINCTDELGTPTNATATAIQLDILLVWNPQPDSRLTIGSIIARQRITDVPAEDAATATDEVADHVAAFLAQRGFAVRERAVVVRRPSWER